MNTTVFRGLALAAGILGCAARAATPPAEPELVWHHPVNWGVEGRAFGDDSEATTDGSHPSDSGFVRRADVFEPLLSQIVDR